MIRPEAMVRRLAAMEPELAERLLRRMEPADAVAFARDFEAWAHRGQRPPRGNWRTWLILAGRGFGKTRAGAEWVNRLARRVGQTRIALVGATLDEARAVMVEGESGLLACAGARPPSWEPSKRRLTYRGGAIVELFSAEAPDGLRGPQHQYAWCDELAKWANPQATWSNLMLGLRGGREQKVLVTTTPRPGTLLKTIMADPATVVTRGRTADNRHLSAGFRQAVEAMYAGTRLGRQELDGELIEDAEGALWTRAMVEGARLAPLDFAALRSGRAHSSIPLVPSEVGESPLTRIVIGVDPPASATGDACGIVAVGLRRDGVAIVLADASVEQATPERWAGAVAACAAAWRADRVVAEANNGGDMVRSVLRQQDAHLPVTLVRASRGKVARAEPVSFLYAQGRVKHAGAFPELEDQLCGLTIGGDYQGPGRSPDRADALVWALTELMLRRGAEPRVYFL